ncbi:PD-(D/E)XK nuclease family protein [Maribacter confluentis]|uniref:PD-(D/E)XK nuclease family protein n=1 Tax=Maribacter confluentis TaxID=1656093 RepID=A0ABT8RQQ7_9FLAO|nr:PD-(D/E)XK nuclease family protein [Maribacter confluentis]MDO1512732.1 PD-(D/E)XK nuclease family protein [Maribacter confluentis]
MQSFIKDVVKEVLNTEQRIQEIIFVLPSKRAGVFLKRELSKNINQTVLAPEIYSIEDFIAHISGLVTANATTQLFELYKAYLQVGEYEKESFDSFLKWGQILLQDFNEIDRYLVNAKTLYQNVAAIQEVNHWSLNADKSEMIENYLHFWRHLEDIYQHFNKNLIQQGLGHQGLIYKTSVEKLPQYLENNTKKHVFLGFNALNKAESLLIQSILQQTNASAYWDIDTYFLKDPIHDAGYFIRTYQNTWPVLKNKDLQGVSNHYLSQKNIEIIGVPKNISQVNYVGHLLKNIKTKNPEQLKNAAIVLGNEELLNPLLHFIPKEITATNITMGQKLELTTLASFFLHVIEFHEQRTEKGWFYKHLLNLLTHSYTVTLLNAENISAQELITKIKTNNWSYITMAQIASLIGQHNTIDLLFKDVQNDPKILIDHFLSLVQALRAIDSLSNDVLILEQLYKFYTLFNQLKDLCNTFTYINSLKSLKQLFRQLLSTETLDFQGNPTEGIQIMGMLESRLLDFKTVILTSVNEGILPSGKSNNSFIPFDLKTKNDLPTYKEKDAVYTYHFYRLLQRAKNVYILYNTEPDALEGGEKSRLITQLLTDEQRTGITEYIATPQIQSYPYTKETIPKTESLLTLIHSKAAKGFSPSSLSNYIRNPIDFYKQNLLNINDVLEVEETLAPNTFGTIVHDSLEALYTPLINTNLTKEGLTAIKKDVHKTVLFNLKKTFKEGNIESGKNYITFHVILKYIQTFIDVEIDQLAHHTIKIIGLEQDLQVPLHIDGLDFPIILKGKLDRIDEFDGVTRIIDYKTGRVDRRNVELMDWDVLTQDYQYSKAFQLLCYGLMYFKTNPTPNLAVQAGIISLKNFTDGTLLFAQKESARGAKKNIITHDVISDFEQILGQLITEICNPEIPFTEKEV